MGEPIAFEQEPDCFEQQQQEEDMQQEEATQPFDPSMTEDIGKLALALSKAQGDITGALKDSTNPFFKSNYADLGNVLAACREPLSKNELAVIQTTEPHESGVVLITTLVHSSGQWIRGKLRMTPTKNDPQGIGSTLTYARRYSYAAIVGVAQVDDDGNTATMGKSKPAKLVPAVEPDPDALASLSECASLDTLSDHWKSLTPAQRTSIGKDRLEGFKKALSA